MSNQQFNIGQEIVSQDLNTLQSRLEREVWDKLLYEITGRKSNAFFNNGFQTLFQSSLSVVVKAGLGFQTDDTGTKFPVQKPLYRTADFVVDFDTPDSSDPRIDLICVKHNRVGTETESRKFKAEFDDTVSTNITTVANDWLADINYVVGTPAPSPAAPSVPVGYLAIATVYVTASTGIANQAAITDLRAKMPLADGLTETGSSEYDAIVGTIGTDQGANYADLKSALDNSSAGWKILVLRDQTINTTPIVVQNNIEIVFKRGVTFTKGTANRGLQVNGNDCKIVGGRFAAFSTAGDFGIYINSGALRTVLNAPRFNNCDGNASDNGTQTLIDVLYTE